MMKILKSIILFTVLGLTAACGLSDNGKTITKVYPTEHLDSAGNPQYAFEQVTGTENDNRDYVMQLNGRTVLDSSIKGEKAFEGQAIAGDVYRDAAQQIKEIVEAAAKAATPASVLPPIKTKEAVPETKAEEGDR